MNFKKVDGTFLHGINLNNWYPCWNFTLTGRLVSANFLPLMDSAFSKQKRIEDISMDELKLNPSCFTGTLTPRAMWYVWAASIIRSGGHVGIGDVNTKWLGKDEMSEILRIGDAELELEKIRREVAPDSCSRLGCLWVADDSEEGATNIRSMLGSSVYIAKVCIPSASKFTRVDRSYFDLFIESMNVKYGEQYWLGQKYGDNNTWEYLVDGIIESVSDSDRLNIKKHGQNIF